MPSENYAKAKMLSPTIPDTRRFVKRFKIVFPVLLTHADIAIEQTCRNV